MTDSGLSGIIEKLREENAFLNDMLENAHNRSRLLEQQLQQAHRQGWEQAKREAFEVARTTQIGYIQTTIAAMEYNEKEELKNWCDIEGVAP